MKVFININNMYDKYLLGNTFLAGSTLYTKHKGFVIHAGANSATNQATGFTAYLVNNQGNTIAFNFPLAAGANYFPHNFYSIVAMTSGVTGLMLN
jgi:hypothetical protein